MELARRSSVVYFLIFAVFTFQKSDTKECYRCKNAQTFSANLTTSLLRLNAGKPCVLETIRCAQGEQSCVYGLVSVVVAGGFWFHLSGCYVEAVNETHCFRGAGPVNWPGYAAELRANYCLCGGKSDSDLCNDSRFAKAVIAYNLYDKKGGERLLLPPSAAASSIIKNRAATGLANGNSKIAQKATNGCTKNGRLICVRFITWVLSYWALRL